MKRVRIPILSGRQHGFSLLELLIATSIGMVITVGAIAVFANSSTSSKTTEAQSRMNEDAQAALSLLSKEIKMAGYKHPDPTPQPCDSVPALTIHGCSGMLKFDANSVSDNKLKCEINSPSPPHSLFLRYEADAWNTTASAGKPTDCLGFKLAAPAGLPNIAENRYYIGTSPIIFAPSLYCQGNGGLGFGQPLIENIEDLKFSFGTAVIPAPEPAASASASASASSTLAPQSCGRTKQIAGYLSATEVENLAPSQSNEGIAKAWNQVLTVQICIVVRSEAKNLVNDNASSTYTKCDGTQDASQTDRRLRRAYTTTVALRNRPN